MIAFSAIFIVIVVVIIHIIAHFVNRITEMNRIIVSVKHNIMNYITKNLKRKKIYNKKITISEFNKDKIIL